MIQFMVLSAPRSGSTWAANWLTTERRLCLHDPVFTHRIETLDEMHSSRPYGISCTGIPLIADWVNQHPARKIIVHRDRAEIDQSLVRAGLSPLDPQVWDGALDALNGLHVETRDLFSVDTAAMIHEHLTGEQIDAARHALLVQMHIDPHFPRLRIDPERTREFRDTVRRALG